MSKRKHGLGVLGLLAVAALGVMAFASSAQAVTPQFSVNGAAAGHTTVEGEQEGVGTLLIPALNVEINCTTAKVLLGLILTSKDADASVLYEDCTVLSISKFPEEITSCHVSDVHTGNPSKLHVTALNALLLPIEFHEKGTFDYGVLIENINVFVNFLEKMGCTLPLKNKISGTVCALIEPSTNDTTEPLALFSQAIQELEGCKDSLLFGAQPSFIDGSVKLWIPGKTSTLGVLLL